MAIKLAEQTNGPHIFMRLRLDSGRVEEIDAYITEEGWRYVDENQFEWRLEVEEDLTALCHQRRPHPGGAAADHCGVSYAVLTCFLYISRGGCRFSASSPLLTHKDVIRT